MLHAVRRLWRLALHVVGTAVYRVGEGRDLGRDLTCVEESLFHFGLSNYAGLAGHFGEILPAPCLGDAGIPVLPAHPRTLIDAHANADAARSVCVVGQELYERP